MAKVIINEPTVELQELADSAKKLRRELLLLPVKTANTTLQYMTPRVGVRVAETVGTLKGDMQFGPYSDTREDDDDVTITPRTLLVYLGSVVKNFKPNEIVRSIWGPTVLHGEAMKQTELVRMVLSLLAGRTGENLNDVIFNAVRNAEGSKTKDLFDGFDTIFSNELTATKKISEDAIAKLVSTNPEASEEQKKAAADAAIAAHIAKGKTGVGTEFGNYYNITESITSDNAYDVLRTICKKANEKLMDRQQLYLFCPKHVVQDYEEDYRKTVGSVVYNKEFKQPTIEGFDNVRFIPLSNKKGSSVMQLTTKKNMLYGLDAVSDMENIEVARFKAFTLQFIATMFFGVQYESIEPEDILFIHNSTTSI